MSNSLSKQNTTNYFNRAVLMHIALIIFLYLSMDVYLLDYSNDKYAYSKSYYAKFLITVFYLIGSKQNTITTDKTKGIDAAFHFSGFIFCIWLAIMSFTIIDLPLSRYIGLFLIFGCFAGFNLMVELLRFINIQFKQKTNVIVITSILLKVTLFTTFCLAVFFLVTGEWRWDVIPFEEWY